jgi:hypothetical protein
MASVYYARSTALTPGAALCATLRRLVHSFLLAFPDQHD